VNSPSPLRLGIVAVVMVSLFVALLARMWTLQILDAEQYTEVSQSNRIRVITEEAPRGRILDVTGRVVVDNRTSRVVTIARETFAALGADEQRELLGSLAAELTAAGVPTKLSRLERIVVDPQFDPLQPVPVAIDVPEELEIFLVERSADFPGVAVRRESVRSYPYGSAAAHVVGYVGRISQEEFAIAQEAADTGQVPDGAGVVARAAVDKPYQPDSGVGLTGIERAYEAELRGIPGRRTVEIDSAGTPVRDLEVRLPVPGNDVQLTLDIEMQRVAEAELAAQLESMRGSVAGGAAPAGAVVMADPNNGDLRVMASYPTFDPADFVNGISSDRYEALTGGKPTENPLPNRALSGQYAPGSTFKPITAWGALAQDLIDPQATINDPGFYYVGGCGGPGCRRTNDGGEVLGPVDVTRSLTRSSNVFYYWIGDSFWSARETRGDLFQQWLGDIGFGQATNMGLPGEAAGVVPGPQWKAATWEALPDDQRSLGDPTWYPGDEASLAIGQGDLLVTPVQMSMAFGAIANGGTLYRPHVVARVLTPGETADDPEAGVVNAPEVIRTLPMEAQWRQAIVAGMAGVTQDPSGTAAQAFAGWDSAAWPVAAKTGTAEVQGRTASSVFGAFGPVRDPEIVAFAVLEEAGYGGAAAAPMVRRILDGYLGTRDPASVDD